MEGRGGMEMNLDMEMEIEILLGIPWMMMPCLNCRARRSGWMVRDLERWAVMLVMFRTRETVLMGGPPAFSVGELLQSISGDGGGVLIQMYILVF
jgi:hypothetical protein